MTITNPTPYSERMKLADVVAADNNLLSILQRLKISLGFGDATVADICHEYGLSTNLFLIICNVYSFDDYIPHTDSLKQSDIFRITDYLRASHAFYKEVCFPEIHNKIHCLVKELDEINRKLIDKFYDDYDNEVSSHFRYEESIVFPYIDMLLHKQIGNLGFSIAKFEENHSNISEKLNDLKNIIMKYLPKENSSPLTFDILKDIYAVETDLRKHSLIENRLLIPLVEKLENSNE